jgi:carboxylesterase type B
VFLRPSLRIKTSDPIDVAVDTHITLCSELFKSALPFQQAILQSGVGSLTIRSAQQQETVCEKLMSRLRIPAEASPKDKLRTLREVSADDLVLSYIALGSPVPAWQATVDGYFLKQNVAASTLSSQKYHSSLKRILMGDCAAEGLIFAMPLQKQQWTFNRVKVLAVEVLGEERASEVLQTYGISSDLPEDALLPALVRLLSDAEWSQPMREVAKSFSNGDVFYYHMAEGNPFDGPNKGSFHFFSPHLTSFLVILIIDRTGMAHHTVDLLYIFLTYQEHLPTHLAKLAETIATQWLRFVNGGEPWKPYDQKADGSSTLMYFGPNGEYKEVAENAKPAYENIRLCERLQDSVGDFAGILHR